ncbi:P27 family phage terminase small subunit [Prevotella fusca]|uniref:P27 family phage terminase small subunit n=1 Tax=Prevotella fusca JCM 17724 TaxID=1236517 RepID=A0A0K1NIV9_9BACT|nr:P27 family phage terminase small subunit [Prevotella fusca]AKU68616.1 hypothetical protein ADJ77_01855 [Prevotella fusca JCM 17724]QUB87571.1 P27 family phage terminase small subunit [Prevotella fusca JCM 17724]
MITKKKIQQLYPDIRESVQDYIFTVYKFLIAEYGEVKPEWKGTLNLLTESLEMFYSCKDKIKEDGLLIKDRYGNWNKHSLLMIQNSYQIQILKCTKELGLSPLSNSKIETKPEQVQEETAEDFIKKLTGE